MQVECYEPNRIIVKCYEILRSNVKIGYVLIFFFTFEGDADLRNSLRPFYSLCRWRTTEFKKKI